jgi:hypothetical protein
MIFGVSDCGSVGFEIGVRFSEFLFCCFCFCFNYQLIISWKLVHLQSPKSSPSTLDRVTSCALRCRIADDLSSFLPSFLSFFFLFFFFFFSLLFLILSSIWSKFIPGDDYHVFQRGAYFSTEVIPDQLAVISLNTLYWYDANKGEGS